MPLFSFRVFFPLALLSSALSLSSFAVAAESAPAEQPWATNAVDVESGVIWQIGKNTPFPYRLIPTQLSWRTKKFLGHAFSDGSHLVVRNRFTLLGTVMQNGPESRYIGLNASPSLEWWDKTATWSLFAGSGGGVGLLDSRGIVGGQGQDFTLNWFIRGGIEHVFAQDRRLSVGFLFQHMSNGGQTYPNPGIDALGFTLGYSWGF